MDIYQKIHTFKTRNIPSVVVTAIEKEGQGPVEVGKKMIVSETGEAYGTVGGGALEYHARNLCKTVLKERTHRTERYLLNDGKLLENTKTLPMVCGGVVTLFYEYIGADNTIYIFGAGHVGQALVNTLRPLNFHLIVIDERKEVIDAFTGADQKIHTTFTDYLDKNPIKEDAFIVVCTPNHAHDYHVINKVIEHKYKPKYMGMLCSKEKLKDYLEKTYETFGKDIDLSHFYSPIGLAIGGSSPEAIAISIASEILALHHDKTSIQHMREVDNEHNRYWED